MAINAITLPVQQFQTRNLSDVELLRRLAEYQQDVNLAFRRLQSNVESLQNQLDAFSSGSYTGTIYAVDSDNNTVELKVTNGKLVTAAVV